MKQMGGHVVIILIAALLLQSCGWFTSPEQRVERAADLIAKGEDRAAVIELQNAIRSKPELVRARLLLASASIRLGDPRSALKEVEQATAHGASAVEVGAIGADAYLALAQPNELLERISTGKLVIEDPQKTIYQGLANLALGKMTEAAELFESALAIDPNLHRARIGLAEAMVNTGRSAEGLAEYEKVLSANPQNALAWLGKGNALGRQGNAEDAKAALTKARELAGGQLTVMQQSNVLVALTEVQIGTGDRVAAEATFKELAAALPDWPITHLMGARLAMMRQDYTTAVAEAQKTLQGAPQLSQAKLLLAAALAAQGNLNQAEVALSELVQQAPENLEARKLLAEINLRLQRPDVAVQLLDNGSAIRTDDPQRDALLGWANLQRGDGAAAVSLLERSVAAQQDNIGLQMDLAVAYLANEQSEKALTLLQSIPPGAADARKNSLLIAAVAVAKGQSAAVNEMERVIAANPKDVGTLNLGSSYFLRSGNLKRARELATRAIALQPTDKQSLMSLANVDRASGDFTGARKSLETLLSAEPANSNLKLQLAELDARAGDEAGAIQRLEDIRAKDPKAIEGRLVLARAYQQRNKIREADEVLRETLAISPGNAAVANAVGTLYQEAGRFDEALATFRSAAQLEPRESKYLLNVGRAQLALGDLPAARESFDKALSAQPNSVLATGTLAMLDVREGKGDQAAARISALKKQSPNNAAVAALEGDVAMWNKDFPAAAQAYSEAARLSPSGSAAIRIHRARDLGQLPNALEPLEQWLAKKPDDASVKTVLAEAYMRRGETDRSIRLYESITATSRNPTALNNLAWLYYLKKDGRALATGKSAYDLAKGSPAIADTYGWILVNTGDARTGAEVLKVAAAAASKNAEIRFHYAYALAEVGDTTAARNELQEVLRLSEKSAVDPAIADLKERLKL